LILEKKIERKNGDILGGLLGKYLYASFRSEKEF